MPVSAAPRSRRRRARGATRTALTAFTTGLLATALTGGTALASGSADVATGAGPATGPATSYGPAELSPGRMMPEGSPDAAGPARAAAAVGTRPATSAAAAFADVQGVDVSRYQHGGPLSWPAVAGSGKQFAIVKATEGTGYQNSYFAGDVAQARAAGLVVGAYHFARPEVSAVDQADLFANTLGGGVATMLPPVLDLESTGGLTAGALVAWTHAFLDRLEQRTHRVPMIYTGPSFWSTATGDSHDFVRYPLWIANYGVSSPRVPGGWPTWTLWQYTDALTVPGITGNVDGSHLNGTVAQLHVLGNAGAGPAPVPAPVAGPALLAGTSLRAGQSTTSGTGQWSLAMQGDGNLVVYGNGRAVWSTGTNGNPGAWLVLQADGNAVVYSAAGRPLWDAKTAGSGTPTLQMQNDGDLVLSAGGRSVWHDGAPGAGVLVPAARLEANQYLRSPDARAVAIMQADGNLVVYLDGRAKWASWTNGHPGATAVFQGDGNVVVYAAGRPLWASGSWRAGPADVLTLQADGNLVEYAAGRPRWSTGTHY